MFHGPNEVPIDRQSKICAKPPQQRDGKMRHPREGRRSYQSTSSLIWRGTHRRALHWGKDVKRRLSSLGQHLSLTGEFSAAWPSNHPSASAVFELPESPSTILLERSEPAHRPRSRHFKNPMELPGYPQAVLWVSGPQVCPAHPARNERGTSQTARFAESALSPTERRAHSPMLPYLFR